MKGPASIQWDELQIHRERRVKSKIKTWDKMLDKIKIQFMPKDYQLNLIRQLQNLRQKGMTLKEYTKEFFRMSIRAGYIQGNIERVAKYINGLRFEIQDEISLLNLKTLEYAYQSAVRVE